MSSRTRDASARDRFIEGPAPQKPPGPRGPSQRASGGLPITPHMVGYFVVALISSLLGLIIASATNERPMALNSSLTPRVVVVPLIPGDLPDAPPPAGVPDDEADTDFEVDMRACRLSIAAALEGRCAEARTLLRSCRGHMRTTAVANVKRCGK